MKVGRIMDTAIQYRIDLEAGRDSKIYKKIKQVPIINISGRASGLYIYENFQSYGMPVSTSKEIVKEVGLELDEEELNKAISAHQEKSRQGAEQKFKGGLADTSEQTIKYHTATHLLNQALTDVLGEGVEQKGSNITTERLRFDFSFDRKMTNEEIEQVETIVNEKITEGLPVKVVTLPKAEALKIGARHVFLDKYGEEVTVYFIGNSLESAYSKEFCGGPHVTNTNELGHFKITKEEAVAQGVRRIKAILE